MENEEFLISALGLDVFLYLRTFKDLTEEESKQLINAGVSIGRPHGYTFTANGFLYLVSLNIDLFGLIQAGYAENLAGK